MGHGEHEKMENQISVFELFKNYIIEILQVLNVVDGTKKNIRINTLIRDILSSDDQFNQDEDYRKLTEKIRKCRFRGNAIQQDWKKLIRNKVGFVDAADIIDEEKGVFAEDGSINVNKDSLIVINNAMLEPELMNAKAEDRFQFVRNGYFVCDLKDSKEGQPVFNRIVSLKSSFKL